MSKYSRKDLPYLEEIRYHLSIILNYVDQYPEFVDSINSEKYGDLYEAIEQIENEHCKKLLG